MRVGERIYCGLAPCLQRDLGGAPLNNAQVRESRSFGSFEAYYRHVAVGHFIPKVNAPPPMCLDQE